MRRVIHFKKMQGLGNDFVVINNLSQSLKINKALIQKIADRHCGVGCDQVLILEPPPLFTSLKTKNNKIHPKNEIDFFYKIYNANGSRVGQCGNGARCLAKFIHDEKLSRKKTLRVQTDTRVLELFVESKNSIRVNMGEPEAFKAITAKGYKGLSVGMGNPHAVFLKDNLKDTLLDNLGLQNYNVGFMQRITPSHIKLRVFERGVGETLACGSGACAAVAVGIHQGFLKKNKAIAVELALGKLFIQWEGENSPVFMTGPAQTVFEGCFYL